MPARDKVPTYRLHRQSGQAIVTLPLGGGQRKDVLLGPYRSKESRLEFARVLTEWEAAGRTVPQQGGGTDQTIAELLLRFLTWAKRHYRLPGGRLSSEFAEYCAALKPVRELYAHTMAIAFGPLALRAVREKMILSGWCRKTINKRVSRVKRVFAWAVAEELLSASNHQALACVQSLQRGRTEAPDHPKVKPVDPKSVEVTLSYLRPAAAALVTLLRLTGARCGELVTLRTCDVDTTGEVWTYMPQAHKTAHHGHDRTIYLGPAAQEVLRPWLKPDQPNAYLFSPAESERLRNAERRLRRQSPMTPSQAKRKLKNRRQRAPQDHYTTASLRRAISRACDVAFPHPELGVLPAVKLTETQRLELKTWQARHRWHPHQLRHLRATEIRKVAGLDAARVVLGHASLGMSDYYAELDRQQAVQVVRKTG